MAGLIAGSGQGGGPAEVAPGPTWSTSRWPAPTAPPPSGRSWPPLQLADAAHDRFNLRVLNISLGAAADDPATAPLTEARRPLCRSS